MSDEKLTIRMREHGPLVLPAQFKIVDHLGNEFVLPAGKENVALVDQVEDRADDQGHPQRAARYPL